MAAVRAIFSILAGALCAFVLGAMYDYLPPDLTPDPDKWKYLYPWLFAAVGLVSSLVTTLSFYPAVRQAAVRAVLKAGGGPPSKAAVRPVAPQGAKLAPQAAKNEVPGMPSFDFDAAKAKIEELKTGDPSQGAAEPSVSPPAPPAPALPQTGSRPEPPRDAQ